MRCGFMTAVTLASIIMVAIAGAQLVEPSPEQVDTARLVDLFDNHADLAALRLLDACAAVQAQITDPKIDVRGIVLGRLLAADATTIESVLQKVETELAAAGVRVEYVARKPDGSIVKTGAVGAEAVVTEPDAVKP